MSSRGMRVVVFGPWPPPYGGVASHVQDLVKNLAGRGVSLSTLGYGDFRPQPGVQRVSVLRKGWWRTRFQLRLSLGPGVILHDHSVLLPYPEKIFLEPFSNIVRSRGARWILTLHDETLMGRFSAWPVSRQQLFARFIREPDHIICVGGHLQRFLGELNMPSARVTNIPPLLPMGHLPDVQIAEKVSAFLQSHWPVLTTIGAFDTNYDFPSMAKALPAVLQRFPRAGMLMIDAGFAADDEYRRKVLADLACVEPAAYCLLSRVARGQVLHLLKASTIFIRGTRHDAFGLSKAEAILLGTPVIATATGEAHFMRTYEFGNAEGLAAEIVEILHQPPDLSEAQQFYREMAEQALERILVVYDRIAR